MKQVFLLLGLLSTPSFAADTVEGLLHTNPDAGDSLQLADGSELPVTLHFQGGSACGAYRTYLRELSEAEGHVVRVSGLNEGRRFLVDLGGFEILR